MSDHSGGGSGSSSNLPLAPSTTTATTATPWWFYIFPCLPIPRSARSGDARQAAAERLLTEGFQMARDAAGDWTARYAPRITALSDQVTDPATGQPRATVLQATLETLQKQRRAAALYAAQWDKAHRNVAFDDEKGSSNRRVLEELDAQIARATRELAETQRSCVMLERVLRQWAKTETRWKGLLQRLRDRFNSAEFDPATRRRAIEEVSGWSHVQQDPEKEVICAWLHSEWQLDGKAKIDVGWWLKMTYFTDESGSVSDEWTSPGGAADGVGGAHDYHEDGGQGLGLRQLPAAPPASFPKWRDSGVTAAGGSGEKTARSDSHDDGDAGNGMVTASEWAEEGSREERWRQRVARR